MEVKHLQNLLRRKKLSRQARERLDKDLNAIYLRLEKNEYETSSLSQNVFDVSTISEQFYKYMETHTKIAKIWEKILKQLPLNNLKEIVDLCPGSAPKIELALYYNGYKGNVILFEKDKEATSRLIKFMQLINHELKIIPLNKNFFTYKGKFNFVIANHALDDLIISYFAKKFSTSPNEVYRNEESYKKFWDKIYSNKNSMEIVNHLTPIFSNLVNKKGYLCLSQYKSFMEKMLNLDSSYKFSRKVLLSVSRNLLNLDFENININISNGTSNYFSLKDLVILRKK